MRLALGRHHSIPRIFQVPGPLHLEQPFFRVAEISTASAADYWIGSCRWTCARYHQSGIAPARVFLSYYGTDLDKFDRSCKGKLRQELGVNDETKLIGMVAYMYPPRRYLGQRRGIKGHEDLIEAIAICLRKEPAIVGVFIGGAWNGAVAYEQRVRAFGRARCGNRAVFLGARDDAAQLYPDLDVAVHPSYSENVGGAVESLLQEVPTIATNVGGLPDIVIDGETGWLVPPRSPERLAEAILESLYNPGKSAEYAAKGRQLARQLFDVRITAQQVLDIYHAILSKRNVDAHRRN
jgi:glycosyltransferase involved in cell wall biosynthesis